MNTQDIQGKIRRLRTATTADIKIPNSMVHQVKLIEGQGQNEVVAPLNKVSSMLKKANIASTLGKGLYKVNKKNIMLPLGAGLGMMQAKATGQDTLSAGLRGAASQLQIIPGMPIGAVSQSIEEKKEKSKEQLEKGQIFKKLQNIQSNSRNIPSIGG